MSVSQQTPVINIMEKAARKASKKIIRDFGELEKLQVSSKSLGDFVTNTDIYAEKSIIETLSYHYPEYNFITEESENIINKDNKNTFVIDPIDGTKNFIHGIPQFCISIAKLTLNEITDGIILNPISNEFYWTSKGQGAWMNNQRLRVSNRKILSECLVGTGINQKNTNILNNIKNLKEYPTTLRNMGSAALDLAFVAAGKLDAFWENDLNLWDVAAGALLVIEAGGTISEPEGSKWLLGSKSIMASNSLIHDIILGALRN